MRHRPLKLLVTSFLAVVLVASCSSSGSDDAGSGNDALKSIAADKTLVVGVRQDQAPFSFEDQDGKLKGFEVDLAKAIADELKVSLELKPVTSDTRIPLLDQGRVDMIAATVSHYRDREEAIDFSLGYYWADRRVLVRKDAEIRQLSDLKGKKVGALPATGTLEELPAKVPGVKMETFKNWEDAFLSLQQGAIDGVGTDTFTLSRLRGQSKDPSKYEILDDPTGASEFAIGVKEDNSNWRDRIDFILQDMWTDGRWDTIFEQWLGKDSEYGLTKADLDWSMAQWSYPPES